MANKAAKKIHKVVVVREACIGAATCLVIAPKAYKLDESSIAVVQEGAETLDDDLLLMSAQSCPTAAILLFDAEGKQIFPKKE